MGMTEGRSHHAFRFAAFMAALSLLLLGLAWKASPAKADVFQTLCDYIGGHGACSDTQPATKCPPFIEPILSSQGVTISWAPYLECYGYIRQNDLVSTDWSWRVHITDSTGFSLDPSDSGNRFFSWVTKGFSVGNGSYSCNTHPGVITEATSYASASNAYGSDNASEGPILCN
jgi:hypothetical protein